MQVIILLNINNSFIETLAMKALTMNAMKKKKEAFDLCK
jgi:hypothetical protein